MSLNDTKANVVLFKDGREWVASAQRCGTILAEARSTNRVNALADLAVSLLEQLSLARPPVEEERQLS